MQSFQTHSNMRDSCKTVETVVISYTVTIVLLLTLNIQMDPFVSRHL